MVSKGVTPSYIPLFRKFKILATLSSINFFIPATLSLIWGNKRLLETVDYVLEIKPKTYFLVHEGILKQPSFIHVTSSKVLDSKGIKFTILEIDKEYEF